MRDDYVEKTMLGKRVEGYICLNKKEDIIKDIDYVYMNVSESIALPKRDERTQEPIIYKVEGTSQIKDYYITESDRAYYVCDDIKVIKKLTRKDIIEDAKKSISNAYRIVAFYPINEEEGLELAEEFNDNYHLLNILHEIFNENKKINKLYELSKEDYLNLKPKIKLYTSK